MKNRLIANRYLVALSILVMGLSWSKMSQGAETVPGAYSVQHEECLRQAAGVDDKISQCDDDESKRIDAELNNVYKDIVAHADAEPKAALVKAERAWLSFRDAECKFRSSEEKGGTIEQVLLSRCLLDLTNQRVQALKEYLDLQKKYYR
jgi:uncharacterized protein YecT (DUF1311 family)